MANLFSGLEEFGLNNLSNINIYDEEEKDEEKDGKKSKQNTFSEADIILIRPIHALFVIRNLNPRQLKQVG